ncbi:glycosyl hydrolase family 28-related protein [Arthrobacter sp. C9C5]|uniref:glycosyl hydrolase family 28-related protein n=1 Tax=Arthrobacter sp. C9C5 TaxID=2735267 RepID=UPI0015853487|nr:glycosyl hydrolase family 28-related protein [Arthrobacter sp. C9C5]NUU30835.1 hypothetical protein [Arthrobacter sp. C9C5]
MPDYLAVTDTRELTEAGRAVVAKGFVQRSEFITDAERLGVSVKDYGAKGDGVTNDAAAVQGALSEAAKGGVLNFPAGTYYMGGTTLSAVLSGPLSIQGNGVAKLVWDGSDGIKLTQNWATHTVTVDGVTLLTRAKGVGVALEIVGTGQNSTGTNLRPRTRNRGSITRVNIGGNSVEANSGGNGSELTDGWGKGIRLVDVMNFYGSQIHIDGYAGPTPGAYVSTHGIEMVTHPTNTQAVDVDFDKLHVFFVQCALDVTDYEGVLVDQANFIAVGTGFRFVATDSNTPLASFTNSQCAFINKAVDWRRVHQGLVDGANMYLHVNGGNPQGTAVYLEDVNASRVTDCMILGNGVTGGLKTGVTIAGTSSLNVVESCTFYATVVNPVNLGASTSKNKVRNLNLADAASQVVINAAGTANEVETEVSSFFGAPPVSRPQLPPSPTVQDIANALKSLGLVGQS